MKTRKAIASDIFIIAVLVIIGIFVTGSKSYKKASVEDLYGTWVDSDYFHDKIIINHPPVFINNRELKN